MKSSPFKRALTFMKALSAAMALPATLQQAAIAGLGEYRSRGKGLGRHSGKKWGPRPSGKYARTFNGQRECQRRMHQIERGIIAVSA